ncbi:hypothetical protein ANCCAN_11908 [Ancylostoma caninum]|uniref:Uncharacterized protein n=1 Tax=Ancylostoma caninum TaxID=29170 RepID=A0A368GGI6_ANCCA|nr:hypothetical protein ANCCAN_11908 [Ancylostoma caninum]
MYFVVFLVRILQALELPLAPYNVKVFCRQGRRYNRQVQTALECSSSTTACGFFEFSGPDYQKGINKIGVYECVDNGILHVSDSDEEDNNIELFSELCGAVPQCSSLSLDSLNPAFVKYLIIHHGIQRISIDKLRHKKVVSHSFRKSLVPASAFLECIVADNLPTTSSETGVADVSKYPLLLLVVSPYTTKTGHFGGG